MKYNKKLAKKLAEMYKNANFNISTICNKNGIAESTWYDWKKKHSEFSELITAAQEIRNENLKDTALSSTAKLLEGFYYDEVQETKELDKQGNEVITNIRVTRKYSPPNARTVIKVLEKLVPEFADNEEASEPVYNVIFKQVERNN